MRNSIITFVLFIFIALSGIFAQQMPFSSQYYSNQFITNPALTGNKSSTNAFLTHRTQYTGIEGGPQTTYFTIDGRPMKTQSNIGLGLTLCSDVTDILSRNLANVSYSYKLNMPVGSLTFGLALGVINNKVNFSKVVVLDLTDPILATAQQSRTVLNADFGLAYNIKGLELGFAVPQIVGNKVNYQNNLGLTGTYNLSRHYYGSAKYVFDVNKTKGITAFPLFMVRNVTGAPFQYDVNAVIDWAKIGWFGVTYHSNYAVAISAGLRWKHMSIGYAYDLGISRVKSYTGSTSEFLLSYNFNDKEGNEDELAKLKASILELKEKDSANVVAINDLKTQDSIKDSLLTELNIQSDSNTVEIERLKKLLKISNDEVISTKAVVDSVSKVVPVDEEKLKEAEAEKLKAENEKARIEKELADKVAQDEANKMAKELAESNVKGKTDSTGRYSSSEGDVEFGFYIIIGAFGNLDNAKVFTKDAKKKGYKTATIIQNKTTGIHQIVIFKTQDKEEALKQLDGIKKDYFDVWVLTLLK